MIREFHKQIVKISPDWKHKRFLIALSGGLDSVVLATLAKQTGLNMAFCHVNYHLRADASDGDADFVSDLADQLEVPLFLLENDLSDFQGNIQLEARTSRYEWFYDLMEGRGFDYVMTAHHLNDSLETLLFNLGRGTGIHGMTGIPERNERILRPMLAFSREDISTFAKANDIQHREDESNASDKYARNFLRHHVVPNLLEHNSEYLDGVSKTVRHLQGTAYFNQMALDIILEKALNSEGASRWRLDWAQMKAYLYPSHILLHWLEAYGFSGKQIDDFLSKSPWQNGARLLTKDYTLLYDREHFILTKQTESKEHRIHFSPKYFQELQFGDCQFSFSYINVSEFEKSNDPNIAFFDADKLGIMGIRFWKDGDSFLPFGMNGKAKTLKKLFTDAKYDIDQKHRVPLLVNGNDIIWVCGLRSDHAYAVGNDTKRVLRVRCKDITI